MEVCGGQTHSIVKYGIDRVLPPGVELVHVGFALNTIDEAEARRVFEFLDEMKQLEELQVPSP